MPTPPTLVAEYESAWNVSTTPKTASVTVNSGDGLVIFGITDDTPTTLSTPTGGSLTYGLRESVFQTSFCPVYVWTATASSSTTFTLSVASNGGSSRWGFNCLRFSGSDGFGASSNGTGGGTAPSLSVTTTADNSVVATGVGDWTVVDGASRVWRTVNGITPTAGNGGERTYDRTASRYTVYAAYWTDAGAAGVKTLGLSSPGGQQYAMVGVEVFGSSSPPPSDPPPRAPVVSQAAVHRAASW